MTVLKFVKTENGIGSRVIGKLYWDEDEYHVVSGGYGKGAIPDGSYDIERYKAVAGNISTMKSGFVNPVNGRGWFLPLTQNFQQLGMGLASTLMVTCQVLKVVSDYKVLI